MTRAIGLPGGAAILPVAGALRVSSKVQRRAMDLLPKGQAKAKIMARTEIRFRNRAKSR